MNGVHRYLAESMKGFIIILAVLFTVGCRGTIPPPKPTEPPPPKHLSRVGYTIQAGAFSSPGNAARLAKSLQEKGLDAFYFPDSSGLFKVRFGNYHSLESAGKEAAELLARGIITDFYLVGPEDYPGVRDLRLDEKYLRENIVLTAERYLGLPYQWGGSSPEQGFDCSGLVMAAFQLNGLTLPRTSRQQWKEGSPVEIERLARADLLFFSFSKQGEVTHVGLYTGNGQFIHAPGPGKKIRSDNLSNSYFRRTYIGARNYL